jgi:hypothetical protein
LDEIQDERWYFRLGTTYDVRNRRTRNASCLWYTCSNLSKERHVHGSEARYKMQSEAQSSMERSDVMLQADVSIATGSQNKFLIGDLDSLLSASLDLASDFVYYPSRDLIIFHQIAGRQDYPTAESGSKWCIQNL